MKLRTGEIDSAWSPLTLAASSRDLLWAGGCLPALPAQREPPVAQRQWWHVPGTALAAGFPSAPPSEKEDLGFPGTLVVFQVSAIIPVIPNASGVKLKPKDHPPLKLVQPHWFFGVTTVIRLRH